MKNKKNSKLSQSVYATSERVVTDNQAHLSFGIYETKDFVNNVKQALS